MALINCPDCGKEHSDQAVACPQCGRPNHPQAGSQSSRGGSDPTAPKKKGCLFGCLGLVGLFVLFAIASSLSPTDTTKKQSTDTWDEVSAQFSCERRIKELLRDPDSYQFISAEVYDLSSDSQYGKAQVSFRAKNGFGGYTPGTATCEKYNNNGEAWVKVKLD
jgi:hypothetical protein